jgi:hypothetical protein
MIEPKKEANLSDYLFQKQTIRVPPLPFNKQGTILSDIIGVMKDKIMVYRDA